MSKYPTNNPVSLPDAPTFVHDNGVEEDTNTFTRIGFYLPVTIRGTADWRIDVPTYLLERPEAELMAYIRENMHDDGDERDIERDDCDYDYSEITIS